MRLGNSTLDVWGVNFWSICGFVESPRDFLFGGGGLIFAPIRSSPSIGIQTTPPPSLSWDFSDLGKVVLNSNTQLCGVVSLTLLMRIICHALHMFGVGNPNFCSL